MNDEILIAKSIFPFLDQLDLLFTNLFDLRKIPLDPDNYELFSVTDFEPKNYKNDQDVVDFYVFFNEQLIEISGLLNHIESSTLKTKYPRLSMGETQHDIFKDLNELDEDVREEEEEKEYKFVNRLKKTLKFVETESIHMNKLCSNIWGKTMEDFYYSFKMTDKESIINVRMLIFLEIAKIRSLIQLTSLETEDLWKKSSEIPCLNDLVSSDHYLLKNQFIPKIESTLEKILSDQSNHILSLIKEEEKAKKMIRKNEPVTELSSKYARSKTSLNKGGGGGINPKLIQAIQEHQASLVVKPIHLYNTREIHECLRFILLYWKTMDYNNEMEDFLEHLINRICYIINYEEEIDIENLILTDIKNGIINLKENLHKTLFNFEVKYYDIIEKLYRFKRREIYVFNDNAVGENEEEGKIINLFFQNSNNTRTINLFTEVYEIQSFYDKFISSLKNICSKWLIGVSGQEYKEVFKRLIMMGSVTHGDNLIFDLLYPQLSNNIQNITEKIHEELTLVILKRSELNISSLLSSTDDEGNEKIQQQIIKLYDNLILHIFDSIISPPETEKLYKTHSFKLNYYINEALEDVVITNVVRKEPFLAHLFSRIRFHIQKSDTTDKLFHILKSANLCKLTRNSETKDINLITINTKTIFEAIALILIYLKITKSDDPIIGYYFSQINHRLF